MSYPLVSIIIPTHNRRDMVIRLLQSIIASTYKSIEVIVVDDASVDGTAVAIKKAFFHNNAICVERNKINRKGSIYSILMTIMFWKKTQYPG